MTVIDFPNRPHKKARKSKCNSGYADIYNIQDFIPPVATRCETLRCVLCGDVDVYVYRIKDGAKNLNCRRCENDIN
jgi:hypothetical protein